jgi:hypothetical protein
MDDATARKIEQWPLARVRPFEGNPKKQFGRTHEFVGSLVGGSNEYESEFAGALRRAADSH